MKIFKFSFFLLLLRDIYGNLKTRGNVMQKIVEEMLVYDYLSMLEEKIENQDITYLKIYNNVLIKEVRKIIKMCQKEKNKFIMINKLYEYINEILKDEFVSYLSDEFKANIEMINIEREFLKITKEVLILSKKEKYYDRMDDICLLYLCVVRYRELRIKNMKNLEVKKNCWVKGISYVGADDKVLSETEEVRSIIENLVGNLIEEDILEDDNQRK